MGNRYVSALRGPTMVAVLLAGNALRGGESGVVPADVLRADRLRRMELRYAPVKPQGASVRPDRDAAGGVDGHRDGTWGFHTENEANPFWQVDLEETVPLDRLVLYNRCDGGMGIRNSRIRVLLSDDGNDFRQVYQHDGTSFGGEADGKPLTVSLDGAQGRFVRLQLPGTSYFHLDEVEAYAVGKPANVALGKPATQSSVSQWSADHLEPTAAPGRQAFGESVRGGLRLAQALAQAGVDTTAAQAGLVSLVEKVAAGTEPADAYLEALDTVRELALRNPLLDFDDILFVKRAPGMFPHVSDQYYGWWSRAGGGVFVLRNFRSPNPELVCLTEDMPAGNFLRPELSYDGKKVLFAYCKTYPEVAGIRDKTAKDSLPEDAFYHIYEMAVDGTGRRRLTHGRYDDFDARYLPDGRIAFLSTRKGTFLQTTPEGGAATSRETHPDSYVRCGGDTWRPVPVFTLHSMDADGGNLTPISAFENFEWTPSVGADGTILYARWDYIDRFNGHFMSLWSTNPDGTGARLVYGNYTVRPQCVFEARPIPGSTKLVFTATAHHSITGGSLVLLDRRLGTEGETPLERLTPEVCFPETEGWPNAYYAHPFPLSEDYYLVSWGDNPLPKHAWMPPDDPGNPRNAMGLYLLDRFGNLVLLHRDPSISSTCPIPVRPRPRPPVLPNRTVAGGGEGTMVVQASDRGLQGFSPEAVKKLRIVAVAPKVQPFMNSPSLGVSQEEPGKYVLGTVPVEPDGSASFRIPSGIPVFFQALDADGVALQTMRSLVYVQPGETLGCVGCHEDRDSAPLAAPRPLALTREPSVPDPDPAGSWPLRFDELVGPVLEANCRQCHVPGSKEPKACERADLSPGTAYAALLNAFDGDLAALAREKDRSIPGETPARNSKVFRMLTAETAHHGVVLPADDRYRLAVWMDTYAQTGGSYSPQQEQELREFRDRVSAMFANSGK